MKSTLHPFLVPLSTGLVALVAMFMLSLPGCTSSDSHSPEEAEEADGLSEFELEHGIGPITEPVSLEEELDQKLAAQGQELFETKCESCHQMDNKLVGPPLGNILEARSPEFVMNFMLNPSEMISDHPVGQQLLEEYMVEMTYQNVSEEDARAILEYLRVESNN